MKTKEERFIELIKGYYIKENIDSIDFFDKNNEWIIFYKDKRTVLSYRKIWLIFEDEYGMNDGDKQIFLKTMLLKYLKLDVNVIELGVYSPHTLFKI